MLVALHTRHMHDAHSLALGEDVGQGIRAKACMLILLCQLHTPDA